MAPKHVNSPVVDSAGAAGSGDRERFDRAVAPLRRELHAHCYRMLGSVHDADDALQEGLLRAWRAYDRFEGRSSLRTWLYTVVTRTCLDTAKARSRRALPIDLGPSSAELAVDAIPTDDIPWLTPYPDPADSAQRAEHVELAFIATMQHLSGNERAAILLTDVLGFSAADAAAVMSTTPTSMHSALARARRTLAGVDLTATGVADSRPSPSTLALAHRFADALATSDLQAFIGLLAPHVTWQMPPLREWYAGAEAVASFAHAVPMTLCPSWRTEVLSANGQPAIAFYLGTQSEAPHEAWSLTVLTVADQRITAITSFLDPDLFARFQLPVQLPRSEDLSRHPAP